MKAILPPDSATKWWHMEGLKCLANRTHAWLIKSGTPLRPKMHDCPKNTCPVANGYNKLGRRCKLSIILSVDIYKQLKGWQNLQKAYEYSWLEFLPPKGQNVLTWCGAWNSSPSTITQAPAASQLCTVKKYFLAGRNPRHFLPKLHRLALQLIYARKPNLLPLKLELHKAIFVLKVYSLDSHIDSIV